ncbi:hypothetical protein [Pseudanabaena sp. BC1403]|uniref:RipA family octameric membrane protein n=1 Tax=Pseudanabaena sp. BC1403 TaxID=2043171 RepID=UPI000CD9C59A|nr:hypothetical protein [Pseudanabaena sp. BC1403]
MNTEPANKHQCSFDEFKLIYDSAEKVTDRRLSKNSQNYSISVGIVLAIAVIANWSISNSQYRYTGFTLIAVVSIMASVYAKLWLKQILDFKSLNTAKFEVLNEMAPLLKFNLEVDGERKIVSYEPFRREWEILQKLNALQAPKKQRFKALKSTNEELFVPNAFFVIFLSATFMSILAILLNLGKFVDGWRALLFSP